MVKEAISSRGLKLQKPLLSHGDPSTGRNSMLSGSRRGTQAISADELVSRFNLPVGQQEQPRALLVPASSRRSSSQLAYGAAAAAVRRPSTASGRGGGGPAGGGATAALALALQAQEERQAVEARQQRGLLQRPRTATAGGLRRQASASSLSSSGGAGRVAPGRLRPQSARSSRLPTPAAAAAAAAERRGSGQVWAASPICVRGGAAAARAFSEAAPASPAVHSSEEGSAGGDYPARTSGEWPEPLAAVSGGRPPSSSSRGGPASTARGRSGGGGGGQAPPRRQASGSSGQGLELSRTTQAISNLLRDKVRSKASSSVKELREAFQHFNRDGDGEISFDEFLKVLAEQHIEMSRQEAKVLFTSFDADGSGSVSFEEFRGWLYAGQQDHEEDGEGGGGGQGGPRRARALSASKVKMAEAQARQRARPTRLAPEDMARLDELFREKIQNSIPEGSTRVLRAFRRLHPGHGLVVTFEEFRRALQEHSIQLSPEELEDFWDHFQPREGGADFAHFRAWLVPPTDLERPVTPPDPTQKDQVLRAKIKATIIRAPYELMRAFRQVKTSPGSGITKPEFAAVCKKFGVSFSPEEVDAFYDKFDEDGSGEIDYMEFCQWINKSNSTPLVGLNVGNDPDSVEAQKARAAQRRGHQTHQLTEEDVRRFDRLLREKILGSLSGGGHELQRAFRKIHTGPGNVITEAEFIRAVKSYGFSFDDEDIAMIFGSFADERKGGVDYPSFCTWIMDAGGHQSTSIAALQGPEPEAPIDKSRKLGSVEGIKEVIRRRVNSSPDAPHHLSRAFLKGHRAQGLRIPFSAFRAGLAEFAVAGTDLALLDLFAEYDPGRTGTINYQQFVLSFQDGPAKERGPGVAKRAPMALAEAEAHIRRIDYERPGMWQAMLESVDNARAGLVTPQQLRRLLDGGAGLRLLDWDWERFCDGLEKVNGLILCHSFLEKYTAEPVKHALKRTGSLPPTPAEEKSATQLLLEESRRPRVSEEKIKNHIYGRYKRMMKTFLGLDYRRTGTVTAQEFRSCLAQHGVAALLDPGELSDLVTRRGVEEAGRISYADFLQHFLVTMRGRDGAANLGAARAATVAAAAARSARRSPTRSPSDRRGGTHHGDGMDGSRGSRKGPGRRRGGASSSSPLRRSAGGGLRESEAALHGGGGVPLTLRTADGDHDHEALAKLRGLHALLKPTVMEIWKVLRQEFKNMSARSKKKGEVAISDFKSVMKTNGLNMSAEDFTLLARAHKSTFDSNIKYDQFLKSCLSAQAEWL